MWNSRRVVLLLGSFIWRRCHTSHPTSCRSAPPVAFVGGVPPEMESEEVQKHLQQYGSCRVVKRCRGYLYVRFQEAQDLVAAVGAKHLVGGRDLTVEVAKAKKKQWYCEIDPDYPPRIRRLMDGVVHIQNMLSMAMQINIAKQVISLGSARAGFYTPRFEDRAMRLRMFCLGRHWDTQTHSYSDVRSDCDGRPVLAMPSNLKELVEGILSDLKQKCQPMAHKAHFPPMEPDTCIVNWYSTSGSLGVHQDLDESEQSIAAGIPVISISLGSSARFLYHPDHPDIPKDSDGCDGCDAISPRSALLRSGDIFIFGQEARRLRHGIAKVFPRTCPKKLVEVIETDGEGEAGRLNLTFRQTR